MIAFILASGLAAAGVPQIDTRLGLTHGSDIIGRCTDTTPQGGSFCFGFISGVYESVRAYETWLNMREICMPEGVALSDMRNVVVDRIQKHPDDRLGQGASVVVLALKEKWPCAAPLAPPPAPAPAPVSPPRKR